MNSARVSTKERPLADGGGLRRPPWQRAAALDVAFCDINSNKSVPFGFPQTRTGQGSGPAIWRAGLIHADSNGPAFDWLRQLAA